MKAIEVYEIRLWKGRRAKAKPWRKKVNLLIEKLRWIFIRGGELKLLVGPKKRPLARYEFEKPEANANYYRGGLF